MICKEDSSFWAWEKLREICIGFGGILLEPIGRNKVTAFTLAPLHAIEQGQPPVLVVTPADQTITNLESFTSAIHEAINKVEAGGGAILETQPDRLATGYI